MAAGAKGIKYLHFVCRISRNSVILNIQEPEGSIQACSGRALPFALGFILQAVSLTTCVQPFPKRVLQRAA
jgi:hypothetical protein